MQYIKNLDRNMKAEGYSTLAIIAGYLFTMVLMSGLSIMYSWSAMTQFYGALWNAIF